MVMETDRRSFMKMLGLMGVATAMPKEVVAAALALDQDVSEANLSSGLKLIASSGRVFNCGTIRNFAIPPMSEIEKTTAKFSSHFGSGYAKLGGLRYRPLELVISGVSTIAEITQLNDAMELSMSLDDFAASYYNAELTMKQLNPRNGKPMGHMMIMAEQALLTDVQCTFDMSAGKDDTVDFDVKIKLGQSKPVKVIISQHDKIILNKWYTANDEGGLTEVS